ncbi:hypothetical protein BVJ53_06015 [Lacticaseibacillus chiayiensis]|uniref:Transcription elongation factor GreAB n=1 Tax=Lacticaseibacillus chiayiensis TaxID=2100821 RepID=A0A4Q1U4Y0_9LACO|nr:hypothetical protein [Lacticaseibacillus chiayiensis]QVI35050.1 hypothetical protein KG086_01525 [Lacticaseibacillus chiayiensis]RXT26562.1 hypothetical protein BVJ53_06015 [Lacticaseibacillus chiayiensis]RXT55624.1 hypothetical protein CHT97_12380 [Lacticaseibacillus chiayiensis]UYN56831.1 hypothetical protein OFW50_01635 [Lacticaseibacillus chiayiensis]
MSAALKAETVQYGKSLALILPDDKEFEKGQTWLLVPLDDNEPKYTLIPKLKDPYAGKDKGSMYVPEEWPEFSYPDD